MADETFYNLPLFSADHTKSGSLGTADSKNSSTVIDKSNRPTQTILELQEWDPLSETTAVQAELVKEQKRQEIRNILKSYTGFYDLYPK